MALVFLLRASDGREFPVAGALRIGRAPESEIVLADDRVSRLHARVWPDGDRLFVRDEGSSNGTTVNGRPLAAGQTYRLRSDDRLGVGSTIFTVATGLPATGPQPTGQAAPAAVPPGAVPPTAQAAAAQPAPLVPQPPPYSAPLPATGASMPATTRIDNPAPVQARAASHRSRNLLLGGCLALVLLVVCGGLGVYGATAGRPALGTALAQVGGGAPVAPTPPPGRTPTAPPGLGTTIPATPGPTSGAFSAQVVSTSPPVTSLAPAAYAATGQDLAATLAALNQAQLRFISDAKANRAALDEDLRTIAAGAFKLGLDGETLAGASAAQDNASDPALTMAGLYAGLARDGFAQAIDAQNMRTSLAAGTLDAGAAVAQIADYGARAWNPDVVDPAAPGNPFLAHLSPGDQIPTPAPIPPAGQAAITSALGSGPGPFTWLAAPSDVVTRTVSLPIAPPLTDPQDPALLARLITPAGQADRVSAQQAAAEGLLRLGASQQQPTGHHPSGQLAALWPPEQKPQQAEAYSSPPTTLVSSATKTDKLQAFGNGHAAAAKANPPANGGSSPDVIGSLFSVDGTGTVVDVQHETIGSAPTALTLEVNNIQVVDVQKDPGPKPIWEANAAVSFDVDWQINTTRPRFTLFCANAPARTVTTQSGHVSYTSKIDVVHYPGVLLLTCYADPVLGSVSVTVLVGDVAGATERAAQAATDDAAATQTQSAAKDATASAVAQSTTDAAATQAQGVTETAVVLGTQNALETEQAASQTAEFRATITEIAHLTAVAVPPTTEVPSPTATFVPVLVDTFQHPGTVFAVSSNIVLQQNRLYQFCFSGTVNLINPTKAAKASDIDHVNGVAVPLSECLTLEGTGKKAVVSCGSGEVDSQDPGGYTIQVVDLGPT